MTEVKPGRGSATIGALRDITLALVALLQALLLFVAAQAAHRFDVVEGRAEKVTEVQADDQQRIARLEAQYEEIQRSLVRIEKSLDKGSK